MQVDDVPLSRLKPAPWNPRLIRDVRFKSLCKSVQADPEFLYRRPVLAMGDGTIYAGNMRYRAAERLGLATVPAVIEDIPEALAKERALRDNQQWGEWNEDELAEMLYELKVSDRDIENLGFDEKELARLLASVGMGDGLTDDDAVPEAPEEPVTKQGDLWLLGEHRVLCGDSTKAEDVGRLLGTAKPALMVTDPPYGVEYDATWRQDAGLTPKFDATGKRVEYHNLDAVTNDQQADWTPAWALFSGDVAYVWHSSTFSPDIAIHLRTAGFEIRASIIWRKPHFLISRGHYHWQHEPCWYVVRKGRTAGWIGDRKQTTVWDIMSAQGWGRTQMDEADGATGHGTQKPVECMERPIRNHEGDVYDPFLGSGTTLIACEKLGRRCYGMEIEPRYVDVIVRRWEEYTGKKAILDGGQAPEAPDAAN